MRQILQSLAITIVLTTTTHHTNAADPPIKPPPPPPLLTGNHFIWDQIFTSRTPQLILDGHAHNIHWTEGPVLLENDTRLLFSDTIGGKLYSFDLISRRLRIVKERSGDGPPSDDYWRAEPGSNGLAVLADTTTGDGGGGGGDDDEGKVLVCQHGARRVSTMSLNTPHETKPLATEYNGRKLNGPNDIILRSEEQRSEDNTINTVYYAYFTDPVYAWLEKSRFDDLPYLDEHVREKGPGHCGVYRVEIPRHHHHHRTSPASDSEIQGNKNNVVELITSDMVRPNGIGFDGDDLIVSDCCQGSHLEGCTSGTSRWKIFRQRVGVGGGGDGSSSRNDKENPSSNWVHGSTVEDVVSVNQAVGGCADGFAVYHSNDNDNDGGGTHNVLLASCFGGFCIVDVSNGEVVARIWTAKEEYGGCRITNAVVGRSRVYLTSSCGIFELPLRRMGEDDNHHGSSSSGMPTNLDSKRSEL